MKKSVLTDGERHFLSSIELSNDEIDLYELLLSYKKPMTAQETSYSFLRFPSAMYRLFYGLEVLGLVRQEAIRPKSYIAVAPSVSFSRALELRRHNLEAQLTKLSLSSNSNEAPVEIIIGRKAQYNRFILETSKTKFSISDHSIGIAYSDNMYNVSKLAMKRGVKFRFIFQQYKPSNFHILHKWKEIGLEMRHLKSERGFHMSIFDNSTIIVSFSNPTNTDDRLSIVTTNKTAVNLFLSYFESIWCSAEEVTL